MTKKDFKDMFIMCCRTNNLYNVQDMTKSEHFDIDMFESEIDRAYRNGYKKLGDFLNMQKRKEKL